MTLHQMGGVICFLLCNSFVIRNFDREEFDEEFQENHSSYVLLSLNAGITLVGCNKTEPTVSRDTGETYDLALCFASEPQTIDPTLNTTVDGAVMIQHAFEGLMKWGDAAPDESTFQVTLTYDCPYFLEICAFAATFPVRKDIIEAYGDTWTTEDHSAYYISNGPYKLEEWVHDSYIKLVPNQFYYDVDNLGPDSITFQLMADQNSMLAGYRAESLHFIRDVPVDETTTLLASGELDIVEYIRTYYALYQTEKAPFDDWRVRKAFTLVINSPYIVEYITQSGEVPAAGFVPSGIYDADPAVRMAAMHRAEDIIIGRDWALGPIYFHTQKFMLKDNIDGVFYTPLGYFLFYYSTNK